jgi:DNA-binding NarL/FixJ family response regulator
VTARRRSQSQERSRRRRRRIPKGADPKRASAAEDADLPLPAGIGADTVVLGEDEYLILTVPIPAWDVPQQLTEAERAVALAVLRGASNEQIAHARRTSVHTVANQIGSIFTKLRVASRIELAHRLSSKNGSK